MPTVCDLEGTVKGGKWGRMRKGREKSRAMCVVFWIILLPRQRAVFRHFPKVVAAVLGEATFGRLCKSGVRLFGCRYEFDAFEEAWWPDAFCSRCSEWKHIAPHCLAPRCALCARGHLTTDHGCPVEGCRVGKSSPCPHGVAKCANCSGSHGARADVCAARRKARLAARGWRSPPPERRARRTEGAVESLEDKSPEVETPVAQEGSGEAGVERGSVPAPEEMEE